MLLPFAPANAPSPQAPLSKALELLMENLHERKKNSFDCIFCLIPLVSYAANPCNCIGDSRPGGPCNARPGGAADARPEY